MIPGWLVAVVLSGAVPEPPVATCPRPRAAQDVARRAVALGLLSTRAWLESKLLHARTPRQVAETRTRAVELVERARVTGAWNVMSTSEQQLLALPSGAWTQAQLTTSSWDMEGAGTLVWALKARSELPGYAAPMSTEVALKAITPKGAAEALVAKPAVRDARTLQTALGEALLFSWRVDVETQRRGKGVSGVEPVLRKALASGTTRHHNGQDLTAGDSAVSSLDDRQLGWIRESARARAEALRFACGL
jgi:hypothetical protein